MNTERPPYRASRTSSASTNNNVPDDGFRDDFPNDAALDAVQGVDSGKPKAIDICQDKIDSDAKSADTKISSTNDPVPMIPMKRKAKTVTSKSTDNTRRTTGRVEFGMTNDFIRVDMEYNADADSKPAATHNDGTNTTDSSTAANNTNSTDKTANNNSTDETANKPADDNPIDSNNCYEESCKDSVPYTADGGSRRDEYGDWEQKIALT